MISRTIFINGRFLTRPITGVQRYALEVMRHMDLILGENPAFNDFKIICLAPPAEFKMPGWKNIPIKRIGFNRGNLWEQVDLPLQARGQLLFSPANSGPWHYENQVITLQDAATFAVPHSYSLAFRAKYKFLFGQFVRRARRLLTVSEFSRAELAKYLGVPLERFLVIPSGSGHLARAQADPRILADHGLQKNSYWLLVVSPHRHKNIAVVEEAIRRLSPDQTVVIAGIDTETASKMRHSSPPGPQFQWLGYQDDDGLRTLYENARALIVPSVYEGFGLPVLEAMECGCPVISARSAALPEVAADAALYFDPQDAQSLAAVLGRLLTEPALAEDLRRRGYERSRKFAWSACAQLVLEILASAAAAGWRPGFNSTKHSVKRTMDLVQVLLAFPMVVVLVLLIAVAIRLDSPGPVFYSQKRIGHSGKEITIWKFRSMVVNAEEILRVFLERSPVFKKEWEDQRKLKNDPRITRFGKILRHTSLDELPQLWNVLRGQMSLIGPRPIVAEEIELYGMDFETYKQVLPGLTGMWQISGRNDLPFDDRVSLDVYYIQNWSIWLDLYILFQTILVGIQGRGAY